MVQQLRVVQVSFKRFFYDRERVKNSLDKKRLASLRQAGLTIRKAARRRLRRRKSVSKSPDSPHVHTKDSFATLKNIQAGFNTFEEAAIVGPIGFGKSSDPAPGSLEKGAHIARANTRRTERRIGQPGEIEALAPGSNGPAGRDKATGRFTKSTRKDRSDAQTIVGWDGRKWSVSFATLKTAEQVRRANEINELIHGPLVIKGELEPRPFMEPAVESVKDKLVDLYLKEGF